MAIDATRLQRHVQLDAIPNVREVGGYTGRAGQTVRWHRLYRAGDLSRATTSDVTTLAELGIRTVIDLRSDREAASRPTPVLPGATIERHHLPLLRDGWRPRTADPGEPGGWEPNGRDLDDLLLERYLEMLVEGSPAIADALALLASPAAYPVLVHSTLGKDRTGVFTAVVLGLLAVHDDVIAEDYAQSARELPVVSTSLDRPESSIESRPAAHLGPRIEACLDDPIVRVNALVGSPPEVMERFLERIRERARSMVGFARSIGVPFESIEALHENLLS